MKKMPWRPNIGLFSEQIQKFITSNNNKKQCEKPEMGNH